MAKTFIVKMLTPDGKAYEQEVDLVSTHTTAGVLGIMSGHLPLEAILDINELVLHHGSEVKRFAIGGGILHVTPNSVTILADSFESEDEIDLLRAEDSKRRAEERLKSKTENIDMARAEISLKKALNRISIAKR